MEVDVPLCSVCVLEGGSLVCQCGTHYCSVECQRYDWAREDHGDECTPAGWISNGKGTTSSGAVGKPVTLAKWREMAHHPPPHGHFASDKQRRYIWYMATRGK
jgi:hypothetical protein